MQMKLSLTHLSQSAVSEIKEDHVRFQTTKVFKSSSIGTTRLLPSSQSFTHALKWLAKSTAFGILVFKRTMNVGLGRMAV